MTNLTNLNKPSVHKVKVDALINWFKAERVLNEFNCSLNMDKLRTENELLNKELIRRATIMQLNKDEYIYLMCHINELT